MSEQKLWIVGVESQPDQARKLLRDASAVLYRGKLAEAWLKKLDCGKLSARPVEPGAPEGMQQALDAAAEGWVTGKSVVYVTAIQPFAADVFGRSLHAKLPDAEMEMLPGMDLSTQVLQRVGTLGEEVFLTLDGQRLAGVHHLPYDPTQAVLIHFAEGLTDAARVEALLCDVYPTGHEIWQARVNDSVELRWQKILLDQGELLLQESVALFVPARSNDSSLVSFEELIAHLRAPVNGCPWDRKQTHDSLRTYLLEETYEALDALDRKDLEGLQEELGDILLQLALHAQIATENHEFNFEGVIEGIHRKLVYRHPHVFGEVQVDGAQGVVQNWEKLKQQERKENAEKANKGLLDGIPLSFPALAQAQSIQDRAARVGFDWKEIEPVVQKVIEEFNEVKTAPNDEERAKELGDLLFAVVNLVRWYHVDAESALRGTNVKFRRRFAYIEQKSQELGKPMQEMSLDEMDGYWNEAKKLEK
jgi:tetrapyrrole methylase family protein/MazG family protein